jgi:hypothetical protein
VKITTYACDRCGEDDLVNPAGWVRMGECAEHQSRGEANHLCDVCYASLQAWMDKQERAQKP